MFTPNLPLKITTQDRSFLKALRIIAEDDIAGPTIPRNRLKDALDQSGKDKAAGKRCVCGAHRIPNASCYL